MLVKVILFKMYFSNSFNFILVWGFIRWYCIFIIFEIIFMLFKRGKLWIYMKIVVF